MTDRNNTTTLPRYDRRKSYRWNYENAPEPVDREVPAIPGEWQFCGLPVDSPLGIPAGPLLNGKWCLYYASLGFDVVTYKTVRSCERECYPLPNLQPVVCDQLRGGERDLVSTEHMGGSWAVAFGMPSMTPDVWRADIEETRRRLPRGKLLSVSVVATIQDGWGEEELANDYAQCARWALDSGADAIETNFSCPNVATCDGQLYQDHAGAARVAATVRERIGAKVPYLLKIGHIRTEDEARELIEAVHPHIDALAMTNSVATTVVGEDGKHLFNGEKRGICGTGILEASLTQCAVVQKILDAGDYDTKIVGVGGVATADDIRRYLKTGAQAVHVASTAMVRPEVGIEIRAALAVR